MKITFIYVTIDQKKISLFFFWEGGQHVYKKNTTRQVPTYVVCLIVLVNDEFGKGYDGVRNQICGYNGAESTFSYMCNLITN